MRRVDSGPLLRWSVILAMFLAAVVEAASAAPATRPNFVIIILDDASWNDIGAYGNKVVQTPAIDQLARDGMRFDNAFVATSSCSPSRSAILTGRYPHATGAKELDAPLPASTVIFPEELRRSGYYAASAGKWHLGSPSIARFDRVLTPSDDSGAADWLKLLDERPRDRPFVFWLSAVDPHRPFNAPPVHSAAKIEVPPFLADTKRTRQDLAKYYDEITRVDKLIGGFLDALSKQGVADDTVVIFLADNGRPFPRSKVTLYDSGVRTPFIVRWPAKIKAGSVNTNLISMVDLAPTIVELAGLEIPEEFQGHSFESSLMDSDLAVRDEVALERNAHGLFAFERAIRTREHLYKLNIYPMSRPCHLFQRAGFDAINDLMERAKANKLTPEQQQCFASPQPLEELYDVAADPMMVNDVSDDPANAATMDALRQRLKQWSRETGDVIDLSGCGEWRRVPCEHVDAIAQRLKAMETKHGWAPAVGRFGQAAESK